MIRVALAISISLLNLIAMPAKANDWPKLPDAVACNAALASGEVAHFELNLGDDPQLLRANSDIWEIDPRDVTVSVSDELDDRIWVFSATDGVDQLKLAFSPLAKVQGYYGILIFHDGGAAYGRLAFANGICESMARGNQAKLAQGEGLSVLLSPRDNNEVGECVGVNPRGEIIRFIAEPKTDGSVTLEPLAGSAITKEISVGRIQAPPPVDMYKEFFSKNYPNTISQDLIYSKDRSTRGKLDLGGADGRTEWMLLIDLWSIEGVETIDTYFASHCGGVGA